MKPAQVTLLSMNGSTLTEAGGIFTRRGAAWAEVTELARTGFRLRAGGPFRGAWMASLSRRLAERHISIDHTHARRQADELWIAELHLITLAHAPDPKTLDYIAFAEEAEPPRSAGFELDSYRLLESRDYGGSLMLTLEAIDSLGLLGSLLGSLAELGLFPLELHIETRDGRAYDSLWLAGPGAVRPSTSVVLAAEQLLARSRVA